MQTSGIKSVNDFLLMQENVTESFYLSKFSIDLPKAALK